MLTPSKDGCDDAGSCMRTPISNKVVREMVRYRFSFIFANSLVAATTSDARYLLSAFCTLAVFGTDEWLLVVESYTRDRFN